MIEVDAALARGRFALEAAFRSDARALALFGASGAGKSTLLGLVAGLLRPDRGRIAIDGRVLVDTSAGTWVPPHRRGIGVVFQDALLFPHLDVAANLRYGLRARGRIAFDDVVDMLGIAHLLSRRPAGLSGGERQRVAIGRALLSSPSMLLLDEPLASLDVARRQELMPYFATVRDRLDIPLVYVSHALEEVVRLADEVVVLADGQVRAQGAPRDLLLPAHGNDPGFGAVSVVEARIVHYDEAYALTELEHPAGRISLPGRIGPDGAMHRIMIRSTDVALAVSRPREISHRTLLQARIAAMTRDDGPLVRVALELEGGGRLAALVTRRAADELAIDVGDAVYAMAKATAIDERAFSFAPGR